MSTLGELAQAVRSKNAGPFRITFDVMFDSPDRYRAVLDAGVIDVSTVAGLYGVPEDDVVGIYEYDRANAIKITITRPVPCGHPTDPDISGAQQHGPLASLDVPSVDVAADGE